MTPEMILLPRMERQYLLTPVDTGAYEELFRKMSPVHTLYWTEPGAPPVLARRAAFDDWAYNDQRRASRKILKGRYQNGSVGYVDYRDLTLYACAYKKSVSNFSFEEMALLELLTREGPLNIGSIKDITGMKVKAITPLLHKLQQAFLVFEDQIDSESDRAWYVFESEFPEIDLNTYTREEAICQILLRFLSLAIWSEVEGFRSFLGFTLKDTKAALNILCERGAVCALDVNGKTYFSLKEDTAFLNQKPEPVPQSVFLLHRSDFLVKSLEHALKKRFIREGAEVLYYIMVDGDIRGAVMGRFKFGPHVIEDVLLDLPERLKIARHDEICEAIYTVFNRDESPIQRYDGLPN